MTRQSRTVQVASRLLRTRWLVRAPIWLYRSGFGWLFGSRLLLLEHRGRRTGQRRFAVLEVVAHTDAGWVIASGFGEHAQWYRNITAHPAVRVSTGTRRRIPATARRLSVDEARLALHEYRESHPRIWAQLAPVFERTLGVHIGADGTTLPLVALEHSARRV